MYNLLVSYNEESWEKDFYDLDFSRFLEYTETEIKEKYTTLDDKKINEILRFPCIFAYERTQKKNPYFGLIREIKVREKIIRIRFEKIPIDGFLTCEQLEEFKFELDITSDWELDRTHWAIKNVNLPRELHSKKITLPTWAFRDKELVDITKHNFEVAFSFPGEVRNKVEEIAVEVEKALGPNSCFYDNNYKAQLARPSLDDLLQRIYRDRSKLIVVFLCESYQDKKWCGIEFKSIKEIIFNKENSKVMYIRMDDGKIDGVFMTDGYIDGNNHSASEIATFITERVELNK